MRVTNKYCTHCGCSYLYQSSGAGAHEFNDGHFCRACKQTVMEALKASRPRQFEGRYRDVLELGKWFQVSIETLLEWERLRVEENKASNSMFPHMYRIFPGLFDLTSGAACSKREVVGQGEYRHMSFMISKWSDNREPPTIECLMTWDLLNNRWAMETEGEHEFHKPRYLY